MRSSILVFAFLLTACASNKAEVPVTNLPALPPEGWVEFCKENPTDVYCASPKRGGGKNEPGGRQVNK